MLRRRLEACAKVTQKVDWLLPKEVREAAQIRAAAPATIPGKERTAWVKKQQAAEVAQAVNRIAILLRADAKLVVTFRQGELSMTANGMPLIDHIFLPDEEGPFTAMQWRLILRDRTFVGEEGAKALVERLRGLRQTSNAELRRQALAAGECLLRYDTAIERNRAEMEALLNAAYRLTPEEAALIARG